LERAANKITIILPVYNGGKHIIQSVNSVLDQEYKDFEFIICDDASTDNSYQFLQSVKLENPDKVKILKNATNLGLFKTLNRLIKESSTNLIHLWSQDDVMKPHCLESCVTFHKNYPLISMSYHGIDYIDENGKLINDEKNDGTPELISSDLYANISIRWGCMPGNIANVTLNKQYVEQVGFFNETMIVSGDFDLWTRLSEISSIGRNTANLIYLRRHDGQLSRSFKSIYLRIKEDIPIHLQILNRLKESDKKRALRWWSWKTQVSYYNDYIFLKRRGQHEETIKLYNLLQQNFRITPLVARWILIKILRVLKLEVEFYKNILDR